MSEISRYRALVAFGSNLGNRERAIDSALIGAEAPQCGVFRVFFLVVL